jgi:hypothetical protein
MSEQAPIAPNPDGGSAEGVASWILALFPPFFSTGYSILGVVVFGWNASDVFFWFWWELTFVVFIFLSVGIRWARLNHPPAGFLAGNLFACLIILFFASLFTILAIGGDYADGVPRHIVRLVGERFPQLLVLGASLAIAAWWRFRGNALQRTPRKALERPLVQYAWPVLVLYFVMIEHHHLTGSDRMDLTPPYVKGMAVTLLVAKFLLEVRRWLKESRKASGPQA